MPFELDPVTLNTIGESDMDGTLAAKSRYAAHYKVDPHTGSVCNFCVKPGRDDPLQTHELEVMEHDIHGKLLYKESHDFPCVGFAHDTAITENFFCFLQPAASLDPLPYILGQKSVAQCITFDQNAPSARIALVPRGKGSPVCIDIPIAFSFHFANAFEEDGMVVIDMVTSDSMPMPQPTGFPHKPLWETIDLDKDLIPYQLRRVRLDPNTASFISMTSMTEGCKTVEFPLIHPSYVSRPYQYAYCLGSPSPDKMMPIQGLVKIDVHAGEIVEKWLPEPHQFISEAVFSPRSEEEDDGYLIAYLMDARRKESSVVVFDAKHPSRGPIASAELEDLLPFSLHGTFVPGYTPSFI
jgi:all-trans-8'-apo-beta-carotenal 15,15'-oxygenase